MKIEHLREFLLLSRTLSFTETAKMLFISQSVLSSHISAMEKELGAELFVRDRFSVRLSSAGRTFAEHAAKVVGDYEEAVWDVSVARKGADVVRIGFLAGSFGSFLPVVCRDFSSKHPEVTFEFASYDVGPLQGAVDDDVVDIAFTAQPRGVIQGSYESRILYQDTLKLVVPFDHELAAKDSVSLDELSGETIYLGRYDGDMAAFAQMRKLLERAGADIVTHTDESFDFFSLGARIVTGGFVTVGTDHLAYASGDLLRFIPFETRGFEAVGIMMWKLSRRNETVESFADYVCKRTKHFSKADYLSREARSLPWEC